MVIFDHAANIRNFSRIFDARDFHHLHVNFRMEVLVHVENIGDPSGHASRKIATGSTKDNDATASHVFASVIADSFNNRIGTRVSNRESFGCYSAEVAMTAGSSVQANIS